MSAPQPSAPPGFVFEDTVPTSLAVQDWNNIQAMVRTSSGPMDLRTAKDRGNVLAHAASGLAYQYLELLSAYELLQEQAERAEHEARRLQRYLEAECCCGEEEGSATQVLAGLIRAEHDRRHHPYGFVACPYETCREASRWSP